MDKTKTSTMHEKDLQQVSVKQRIMKILVMFLIYAFLICVAIFVLFPFYWMLISSVKSLDEYRLNVPTMWPRSMLFSNYKTAFETANLGRLFLNTAYVGIVSTVLSLVITVLSAFAFARLEFKGKNTLFAALLATMMIPGELFTITNYSTVASLGWMKTYKVLIIPFLVSVFYIYLLRQNFLQIPNERRQGGRHKRYQISLESHDTAFSSDAHLHNDTQDDGRMELICMAASRCK